MSKKTFKRLMEKKTAEFRKWATAKGLTFKTTSEIEREKAAREREQERLKRQRGEGDGNNRHNRTGRSSKGGNGQRRGK